MKEALFQQEIARSFRLLMPEAFYYKIPDPQYPKRTDEGDAIRRIIPRPYDCQVLVNGTLFAFELKLHKKETAFPLDAVRENQIQALQKVTKNGGIGIILINVRTNRSMNLVYAFTVDEFLFIVRHYQGKGRKSIPFKMFTGFTKVYGRHQLSDGRYGWNVMQILADMKDA